VDDLTFRQLKESKYYHPEITEVMFDSDMVLKMIRDSMNIAEIGYDSVWDSIFFTFLWKYFRDGIYFIEKQIEDKGIKSRIIVDVNKENVKSISSMKYHDIRHIDNLRGNFGIFDNRAYMVYTFHKESERPDQTLWSNSKDLVHKQQSNFDNLWEIATPLNIRRKELEQQSSPNYRKLLTGNNKILDNISLTIEQTKKELLIFSSNKILNIILNRNNFVNIFQLLLKRKVIIRILTDDMDEHLIQQFDMMNTINQDKPIQLGYSNKLGDFNEMVIVSDNKYVLQIGYDQQNELVASFSNEEHSVLVQEILFEKHWNEVKSLEVVNGN
jgi:hypothetical protein